MLDMGWAELLVIAIVALLAVGPEKLPEVARSIARFLQQVQRLVSEFRGMINLEEFDAQIRQSSRN
ncbi:MAG: twin-arginine translocase subunit TatB, partial [Magnetococcales bacterium]|nr:twin-arginine translocase subunit TatB [Magnetococcales bacterium]